MGPFSLSETLGTYTGLAAYAILREQLKVVPHIIVFLTCLYIYWLWLSGRSEKVFWPLVGYLATTWSILILFWPEAMLFPLSISPLSSTEVVSEVAAFNGAPIQSASQIAQETSPLGSFANVPTVFGDILSYLIEAPIQFARRLNDSALRPFSATMPMNWLLRHKLESDVLGAIHDWVEKCVLPAKARLFASGVTLTYENTLPFGSTALVNDMAGIEVVPARGGFLSFLTPGVPVRCDTYGTQIEDRVLSAIAQAQTPGGQALDVVWNAELGISATDAARLLIYREILATAGPEIPAPSLAAEYAVVRGLAAGGSAITNTLGLSRLFGPGPVAGVAGSTLALGNELGRALDALSALITPALFVTTWAPELLGQLQMIMLPLFTVVLLWSMNKGQHIRPLCIYFALLFVLYSSPIWWAVIELWATSLGDIRPSPMTAPQEWLRLSIGMLIAQTVGIPLVALGISSIVLGFAYGGVRSAFTFFRG